MSAAASHARGAARAFLPLLLSRRGLLRLLMGSGFAWGLAVGQMAFLRAWKATLGSGSGVPDAHELLLAAVVIPLGAAFAAMAIVDDLMLRPLSWILPGVRERMTSALAGIGVLVSLGSAALHVGLGGGLPAAPAFALGMLSYGVGVAWGDGFGAPRFARNAGIGAILLLLLLEPVGSLAAAAPALVSFAALALSGVLLVRPLSAELARRRALTAVKEGFLGIPMPVHDEGQEDEMEDEPPVRLRPGAWGRLALFESTGGKSIGAWLGSIVFALSFAALAASAIRFVSGLFSSGSLTRSWRELHEALHGSFDGVLFAEPAMAVLLISIAAATFALVHPMGLACGLLYPISRSDRARIAFRSSLLQTALLILALGLVLLVLGELLHLGSGAERCGPGLAYLARALALVAAALPGLHLFRLRFAGRFRGDSALGQAFLYGLPMAVLGTVVGLGSHAWTDLARSASPWTEAPVALALVLSAQLASRAVLRRHFARADLA